MNTRKVLILVLAMLAIGLSWHAAVAQEKKETKPWVGMVTGTRVYVRAGPNLAAYQCTSLSKPTKVTVVGTTAGWLKILPPPGTFSAVLKDYVQLSADGKTGTIVKDDIWVRAGGNLRSKDFWAIQRMIRRGEKVDILGTSGGFYRINPPKDAYFYISQRYVAPATEVAKTDTTPAKTDTTPKTTDTPPAKTDTTPQTTDTPPAKTDTTPKATDTGPVDNGTSRTIVKTDTTRDKMTASVEKIRAADRRLLTELKKPIRRQRLKPLIPEYQALRDSVDPSLRKYVDARLAYVEDAIGRAEEIERIDQMLEDADARQEQLDRQRGKVPPSSSVMAPSTAGGTTAASSAIVGILTPSSVYNGAGGEPRRYALYDTAARSVAAYVRSGPGVNLDSYVGKRVSIRGSSRMSEDGLPLIDATMVELVSAAAPKPPASSVRPVAPAGSAVMPVRRAGGLSAPPPPQPKPQLGRPDLAPVPDAPAGGDGSVGERVPDAGMARPLPPAPVPDPAPRERPKAVVPTAPTMRGEPTERPKAVVPLPPPKEVKPAAGPKTVGGVPIITPGTAPKSTRPKAVVPKAPTSRPSGDPLPPTGLPLLDSDKADPTKVDESRYK